MNDSQPTDAPGILVVDDDPTVLMLLRTVLSRRGFVVWAASSGRQAVEVYHRHRAETALALLDVRMPELDGPATLAELRRIEPSLRACFMSGHIGAYQLDDLRSLGPLSIFDKPFAVHAVAEELWRLAHEDARQTA